MRHEASGTRYIRHEPMFVDFRLCVAMISNASIHILQNGWAEICCVTVSKQQFTQEA